MSIPTPSRQLFQLFLSTPFDYFFLFFLLHMQNIHEVGVVAPMFGLDQECVSPTFSHLFIDFDSVSVAPQLGCLISSKHDLTFFSSAFSIRHLWSLFWKWFDVTDIEVVGPCAGVNLTRAYPFCKHYFSFTGIILCGFPSNFWIDILFLYIVAWLFRSFNWIRHLTILG